MADLSAATAVYAGSTLATAVYAGSTSVWTPPGSGTITVVGGETAYGGNTGGDDITVALPAGLSSGDYLLAFVFVSNQVSAGQYGATPSGWTRLYESVSASGRSGWVYEAWWNGSDTDVVFPDNAAWGTSRRVGGVIAFRGVDNTTSIDAVATANPYLPAAGTTMAVPSDLTTVTDGAVMVVVADANTSAGNYATPTADPSGWDRPCAYEVGPGDGSGASASWMHLFTKEAATAGAQSGPSWTWTGSSIASHKAWHLAVRPA